MAKTSAAATVSQPTVSTVPGAESRAPTTQGFSTFKGVFTPTLLTILGVIMYLREGSVVGNAGLAGAWLIITLAFAITIATALSMASITTNIRIGAGGAYSIISQSLGIEAGGAIGIPLYLSQALVVAMYIFGFRSGWQLIFPDHPALLIDFVTFGLLFTIALISADFAFRVQYLILAVIAGSLVSIFASVLTGAVDHSPQWFGDYRGFPDNGFAGTDFWTVFAIFFPAATGIMAGANMSGDLERPRRSIPRGTLLAIGAAFLIYMALAWWLAVVASPEELVSNYTIIIDEALWGPLVIAGLLGATFSSGLASLVGAPRIMQALSVHDILPASRHFARRTNDGEPRNALIFTGIVVVAGLALRDLNAIAPLVTLFFLITYATINVVVLFEQTLDLVSFRPSIRLPIVVPLVGTAGAIGAMFIINPLFSVLGAVVVFTFYLILVRQRLSAPYGDLRSGLFVAIAEWGAKRVATLPQTRERAWKPNLLTVVEEPQAALDTYDVIDAIVRPKGSVQFVGVQTNGNATPWNPQMKVLTEAFRDNGIFASWSVIEADTFHHGMVAAIQTLSGAFLAPNVVFLPITSLGYRDNDAELRYIAEKAVEEEMGLIFFAGLPGAQPDKIETINIWIRDRSPEWDLEHWLGDLNLALLTGYQIISNRGGKLRLISAVERGDEAENCRAFLGELAEVARLPKPEIFVTHGSFIDLLDHAPAADLNIFGLGPQFNLTQSSNLAEQLGATCLFIRDSGAENALA